MPDAQIDNPWQIRPGGRGASATQFALRIETIEGVEPLDNQIGVFPKKTVPDALHEVLFGQPEPNATEIEVAGGDPATVPPIRTYAILDAAKVTNLPEMLEDSKLEHRCLFKGQAYDELKNVAPWIVRLEDDNAFTRNLFTRSNAPWHLWDKKPGIYIRSRGTLDDMWRHFRKFTRVRDEFGRWFYLRFWEVDVADVFWTAYDDLVDQIAWRFGKDVAMVCWSTSNGFVSMKRPANLAAGDIPTPVIDAYRPLFRAARWNKFVQRVVAALGREGHPFDKASATAVRRMCDAARRASYRSEAAIWDIVRAAILLQSSGQDPNQEGFEDWRDPGAPDERAAARRVLGRARFLQLDTG